jgi:hypothetical protein
MPYFPVTLRLTAHSIKKANRFGWPFCCPIDFSLPGARYGLMRKFYDFSIDTDV